MKTNNQNRKSNEQYSSNQKQTRKPGALNQCQFVDFLNRTIKGFYLFFVLLFFTSNLFAKTYYVDSTIKDINVASSKPDCNNYNYVNFVCSGGLNYAYKTINDINATSFAPGDVVLFRNGQIWNRELKIISSGTNGNPITFSHWPSNININLPVIDLNDSWVDQWADGVITIRANYIVVDSFEIRNGTSGRTINGGGWGVSLEGNNVIIRNNIIHNIPDTGIHIQGNNNTIDSNQVYATNLWNFNQLASLSGSGITLAGLRDGNPAHVWSGNTIQNNIVHDNWGEGIYAYYGITNTTIQGNTVYNNSSLNIGLSDSVNGIIRDNLSYVINPQPNMTTADGIVITVEDGTANTPEPKNNQVYNNFIYGKPLVITQYVPGHTIHNTAIYYNTVINSTGVAMDLGGTNDSLIIRNNIFNGTGVNTYYSAVTLASNNYWLNSSNDPYLNGSGDIFGDASKFLAQTNGSLFPGALTKYWFVPISTSPAIKRGVYLPSVLKDTFGNIRSVISPDIGAGSLY